MISVDGEPVTDFGFRAEEMNKKGSRKFLMEQRINIVRHLFFKEKCLFFSFFFT